MKLLLVTFPVDLGNQKFETAFVDLFSSQPNINLKHYRFISRTRQKKDTETIDMRSIVMERFRKSFPLNCAILDARKEGRKILFHGISPALFSLPSYPGQDSFIVTDWTRKLYEPIVKKQISQPFLTSLHQRVLLKQRAVFCLTEAVYRNIATDYDVPAHRLVRSKLPFCMDLDLFGLNTHTNNSTIKILFIGGDLQRKGGDVLLRWFKENKKSNWHLTLVTKVPIEPCPQVTVETNIDYGHAKHVELFRSHDIFVMPTLCDSYPAVLGEAACSGLAILTTKYALGAPEVVKDGINGYIYDSQEALFKNLEDLIDNKDLIVSMKQASRKYMEEEFSRESVLKDYLKQIFNYQ